MGWPQGAIAGDALFDAKVENSLERSDERQEGHSTASPLDRTRISK